MELVDVHRPEKTRQSALPASLRGGRLVLDEPTNLPEGTKVELVPLDDVDALAESIRSHTPGTGVPADAVLARVRSAR